ncbi:MAG: TIGR00730 family Rossman fold protein [Pirellulales bacterium]|nr:TIGR00730 family Rossman fold protein [Pirellulales bacterium]
MSRGPRRRTNRKPETPRPVVSHDGSGHAEPVSAAHAAANLQTGASSGPPAATSNRHGPTRRRIDDLIEQIHQSADKLAQDDSSRGDLKILARTMLELRYAFKVFAPYRSKRKATVFGSARTTPGDPCYQQAVALGRLMAEAGWLVVTGAASGIMEAGHIGAGRENSMGLNIMLPFEQEANRVIADDPKLVHMKYFFTRKLMFVKECHAICLLPGGFGTLDEGMEVLTLIQTGKRDMIPVVFLDEPGGSFWRDFEQFIRRRLLDRGMIAPADMSLFRLTDNVEEAVGEILGFFRVYHSMRYVHERLVLRLSRPIDDEQLDAINREFSDIVVRGGIVRSGPLAEERDEPELAHLPRLVFHFNRYDQGRLRQLIDRLNAADPK